MGSNSARGPIVVESKKAKARNAMLREWEALSSEQIEDEGGIRGFAEKRNVRYATMRIYLRASGGLRPRGNDRFRVKARPVTNAVLNEWKKLTKEQIEKVGGTEGFASKHNVRLATLRMYVRASGGLSPDGEERLRAHEMKPVTNAILEEWKKLTKEQIAAEGGLRGFARKHNVLYKLLERYACASGGLRPHGEDRLNGHEKNPVTVAMLEEWDALGEEQLKREGGFTGFVKKHNVATAKLQVYVYTSGGLRPRGRARLGRHKRIGITNATLGA
ncbi:hypothetical protein [Pandoraea fibrosis]|nr:hypothetical protein [Pandoraea fibrosis]